MENRLNRIATAVLLAGVVLLPLLVANAQQPAPPRRVLGLYWDNRESRADETLSKNFQAVMESAPAGTIEYYSEYLEATRFPTEQQSILVRDYLKQKYADRPIDVILAAGEVPMVFLLKYRDSLFPNTPIVFLSSRRFTAQERAAGAGMTGVMYFNAYKETLGLALKLHPGTEQVFVVSGTLEKDKRYETLCQEQLHDFESQVSINYLTDLAPDELTSRLRSLPKRSVVLYIWQRERLDESRVLETADFLTLVTSASSAPIYGVANWQIGKGIVGGYLRLNEATGTKTGEIVLRILNGERAQDIPLETIPIVPMFDWHELRRWGINEELLPRDSVIRNRVPTFWDEYKWFAIAAISVFIIQLALIAGLALNRAQRKRAEEAVRESEDRFRKIADTAPVMIWVTDADKLCTYFNKQGLDFTGRPIEEVLGYGWADVVHPDDRERSLQTYLSAFDCRESFTMEYRMRRADGEYRMILASGTARFSAGGQFLGYIGSCIDISERKAAEEALGNLSGQLIRAREDECARIARELHDDLNQRMAIISIELDQLGQTYPDPDGHLRLELQKIMHQATDVSREIHRISYDLHPAKLTQLGLITAVRRMCEDLQSRHALRIDFSHEDVQAGLPPDISLCLYRIIQECLNNIIRHSGAKEATVELWGTGKELRLRVADSGQGFDIEAPGMKMGLGLLSMRERLRLVGGQLLIDSRPAQGTQIDAKVPLGQAGLDRQSPAAVEKQQVAKG